MAATPEARVKKKVVDILKGHGVYYFFPRHMDTAGLVYPTSYAASMVGSQPLRSKQVTINRLHYRSGRYA